MLIIFIFKKKNRKTQKLLVYVHQDNILVCGCNQSKLRLSDKYKFFNYEQLKFLFIFMVLKYLINYFLCIKLYSSIATSIKLKI